MDFPENKTRACRYFQEQLSFVQALVNISERLRFVEPITARGSHLRGELRRLERPAATASTEATASSSSGVRASGNTSYRCAGEIFPQQDMPRLGRETSRSGPTRTTTARIFSLSPTSGHRKRTLRRQSPSRSTSAASLSPSLGARRHGFRQQQQQPQEQHRSPESHEMLHALSMKGSRGAAGLSPLSSSPTRRYPAVMSPGKPGGGDGRDRGCDFSTRGVVGRPQQQQRVCGAAHEGEEVRGSRDNAHTARRGEKTCRCRAAPPPRQRGYLPVCRASEPICPILRIPPEEGHVFKTKARAPTLITCEILVPVTPADESATPAPAFEPLPPPPSPAAADDPFVESTGGGGDSDHNRVDEDYHNNDHHQHHRPLLASAGQSISPSVLSSSSPLPPQSPSHMFCCATASASAPARATTTAPEHERSGLPGSSTAGAGTKPLSPPDDAQLDTVPRLEVQPDADRSGAGKFNTGGHVTAAALAPAPSSTLPQAPPITRDSLVNDEPCAPRSDARPSGTLASNSGSPDDRVGENVTDVVSRAQTPSGGGRGHVVQDEEGANFSCGHNDEQRSLLQLPPVSLKGDCFFSGAGPTSSAGSARDAFQRSFSDREQVEEIIGTQVS